MIHRDTEGGNTHICTQGKDAESPGDTQTCRDLV